MEVLFGTEPPPPLSAWLGAGVRAELVEGSERRWPQSHSASFRLRWPDGREGAIFAKRAPPPVSVVHREKEQPLAERWPPVGPSALAAGTEVGGEGTPPPLSCALSQEKERESEEVAAERRTASETTRLPKPGCVRNALSCRAEGRFYSEIAPALRQRGVRLPHCLGIQVDPALDALDACAPSAPLTHRGVLILLERLDDACQHSPLSRPQALASLRALARFHAAAWEDAPLLQHAEARLHPGGGTWWALAKRDPSELQRMVDRWPDFLAAFEDRAPELLSRPSVRQLPARLARLAHRLAAEMRAGPEDSFATLVHGDYKAANLFFVPFSQESQDSAPEGREGDERIEAVAIDYQWCGVGLAMSDVAYHLTHAVQVDAFAMDDGEAGLLAAYLSELRAHLPPDAAIAFSDQVAARQYRLATLDYARLVLSRFVTDASEEAFAAVERSERAPNLGVVYRDPRGAVALVARLETALAETEEMYRTEGEDSGCEPTTLTS